MKKTVLLVGAGNMAIAYAKVLKALAVPLMVVGRGEDSALAFEKNTDLPVMRGGFEKWIKNRQNIKFENAIVATDEALIGSITRKLINQKTNRILIEKPGGLNSNDVKKTGQLAKIKGVKVFVAYNRRFYTSVRKATEIIKKDGGITSFNFEFTEWGHKIEKLDKPASVKKNWLLINSSHVIDLAFWLGGKPQKINCFAAGHLVWHPKASVFAGAGISQGGALFSYSANWESAGRWGVEILTAKRKLILRPLEKLATQNKGSLAIEEVVLDNKLDTDFKPGLYLLVKSFLHSGIGLPTISQQVENLKYYNLING